MQVRIDKTEINGVNIVRRYENDVLVREGHFETLESGKTIQKEFNGNGELQKERHVYGMMDIYLEIVYSGSKNTETYMVKQGLATREKYEKARLNYPDMPPANLSIPDDNADLLAAVEEERKQEQRQASTHVPDLAKGKANDEWCGKLIAEKDGEDAYAWFDNPKATLGIMDRTKSRRLLTAFKNAQCGSVFACDIDRSDSPHENTGHLVVELPLAPDMRAKVFKQVGRIEQDQGYSASLDDGQKYIYVKLD
ncbi:hypothetical protein [Undibacterium sp. Ji49W]|uniref:hypothetical protein n=1 Tax=Undibacterium sp. Ji49W TaxID=3413040 RepID=UPI003BF0F881